MVDTAGTLCTAAALLKEAGARRVFAFASHGVLSGPAVGRIAKSALTELVVLDTVPLSEAALVRPPTLTSHSNCNNYYLVWKATGKITQLSVAPLLAQAIYNIHNRKSISALFK